MSPTLPLPQKTPIRLSKAKRFTKLDTRNAYNLLRIAGGESSQVVLVLAPSNTTVSQIKHAAVEIIQQYTNTVSELEPPLTGFYPSKLILLVGLLR